MKEKFRAGDHGAEQFASCFVYLMTFGVTLGGLCFGYNLAVISGVMLYAQPFFGLDTTWQSLIVGAAIISATVSSLAAGPVADKLGRRAILLMTALVCTGGPVLAAAAPSKEVLLAGRLCTGVSFPILTAFCRVYMAEMTPAHIRGRVNTLHQLLICVGYLLSALMSGAFSYLESNQWRYMLGFAALPGLMFGVATLILPESPRWLIAKGRHEEATRVLQRIYGCEDVGCRVKDINESVSSHEPTDVWSTLVKIASTPHVLKALAVGSCLAFFFVWSGLNAVLFYCGTIMKIVGFPVQYAIWVQGVTPLAMFIGVLPGIFAVENFGRRPIVLFSTGGSALSLALASVGFHLIPSAVPLLQPFNLTNISSVTLLSQCVNFTECESCVETPDCGLCYNDISAFCLPALNEHYSTLGPCAMDDQRDDTFMFALDYCPSPYAWIVVAGLFLFTLFFSPGLAALTFTINAEIYPMWARSICTSLVLVLFWVSNIIITFCFLSIVEALKTYGTFWFFAGMCTLGFVLLAIILPETKNQSLEEVEELFFSSKRSEHHLKTQGSNQPRRL